MAKFSVFLQQYVEEIAEIEVEADSPEQAAEIAQEKARFADDIDWRSGDGEVIYGAAAKIAEPAYLVSDADGVVVWER